jgi:GntR family transcriptional repressor for pyruvate dehydrogenase complex
MNNKRLPAQIAEQLKDRIYAEKMSPGDRLPSERKLASELAVSRIVVREALRSLEQAGLVEIKHGAWGGPVITDNLSKPFADAILDRFSRGDLTLAHLSEARMAVELTCVPQAAAKATPDDMDRISAINLRLKQQTDTRRDFRQNNLDFHVAIAEVSGNPLMTMLDRALLEIFNIAMESMLVANWRQNVSETFMRHERLIQAMRSRDPEACRRAVIEECQAILTLTRE